MTEFGLFNDEGLVEGEFYTYKEAHNILTTQYTEEDDLVICEICPDHRTQPKCACELCDSDHDEDCEDDCDD